MKPRDKAQLEKTQQDLSDYEAYDYWFGYWYSYEEYEIPHDYWEWWYEYQNDVNRIRQEKLEEIFDLNKKPTISDIWPDRKDLK